MATQCAGSRAASATRGAQAAWWVCDVGSPGHRHLHQVLSEATYFGGHYEISFQGWRINRAT